MLFMMLRLYNEMSEKSRLCLLKRALKVRLRFIFQRLMVKLTSSQVWLLV